MPPTFTEEIASAAARLVVEEGLEYGPAKRKAARVLGRQHLRSGEMPSNEAVENEVRAYLSLYHADTQPAELAALRRLALRWMQRLSEYRPHLAGAVWRGTATRLSNIQIDLFCDDPKAAEIGLINLGIPFEVEAGVRGSDGQPVDVLRIESPCAELGERVTLLLNIRDLDDLRGALKPDGGGRTLRGSTAALQKRIDEEQG
ncbi:MAG TPA: hypothetical protein VFP68_09200 [Burkholderiaceae bacterium]|nr:hypothetical protein [Burkholderiaceae bacterium]